MNVNVWDVVDDVQALIRSGAHVDPGRLADPDVPLAEHAAPVDTHRAPLLVARAALRGAGSSAWRSRT